MATKPVLIGATERRAPQLLHCSQASPVGGARRSARGAMGAMGVGRSRMGLVRHGMGLAMIRVKGEGEGEGVHRSDSSITLCSIHWYNVSDSRLTD